MDDLKIYKADEQLFEMTLSKLFEISKSTIEEGRKKFQDKINPWSEENLAFCNSELINLHDNEKILKSPEHSFKVDKETYNATLSQIFEATISLLKILMIESSPTSTTYVLYQNRIGKIEGYISIILSKQNRLLESPKNPTLKKKSKWPSKISNVLEKEDRALFFHELLDGVIDNDPSLLSEFTESELKSTFSGTLTYYINKGEFKRTELDKENKFYKYCMPSWIDKDGKLTGKYKQ